MVNSRVPVLGLSVLVLLTLAVTAACATGSRQRTAVASSPSPGPTQPRPTEPRPTQPGSTAASGARFEARADLLWQDLGTWPDRDLSGVYIVSRDYFVRQTEDPTVAEVIRRRDSQIVLRHQSSAPQFETAFADLAGERVVIVDEDFETGSDGDKDGAQAYVYDLASGRRTPLSAVASAPPLSVYGSQGNVTDDGRFYYGAGVDGSLSNCVGLLDLNTMRGHTVECASGADAWIYGVGSGHDGATWLDIAGPSLVDSCRRGRTVRDGSVVGMGPRTGCATVAATTVDDWDVRVWGSPTPSRRIEAVHGEITLELGNADGPLIECGGWAYWRLEDHENSVIQIRRWRPDREPEIAFSVRRPADTSPLLATAALAGCADEILTVTITRSLEDGTWTTQVLILEHEPSGEPDRVGTTTTK